MKKEVIILTYSFPPSVEIGARRWGKIAFALAESGFVVHVITVSSEKTETKEMILRNGKIIIHFIHEKNPLNFHLPVTGFYSKLKRKALLYFIKLFYAGTYYDKGLFLEKKIKLKINQLKAETNIKNIISTGAPFSFLRFAAEMKQSRPDLNLICDLRDPWTNGHYYGFSSLPEKRKKQENEYEKFVMLHSDIVLCPSPVMTNFLKNKYGSHTDGSKYNTLYHPFDRKEIGQPDNNKSVTDKVILFSGGTIDLNEIEVVFQPFLEAFRILKSDSPEIYKNTEVIFHSHTKKLLPFLEKEKSEIIHFKEKLPADEFFREASNASFLLVFLPDDVKDFFITKFTEFLALKKPLIILSANGDVAQYVVTNKLGLFFNYTDKMAPKLLADAICKMKEGKFEYNRGFDENIFSLENAVHQLTGYFK